MMDFRNFLQNNSNTLLQTGIGLLGGQNAREQATMGLQGFAQGRQANKTLQFLRQTNPELAQAVESGAIAPGDAYKMYYQQKLEAEKPKKPNLMGAGGAIYNADTDTWITPPKSADDNKIYGDVNARISAAEQFGLTKDSPAYQSYVLTGKMPREDQAPLTATDKKAILEADEMVMVNEGAISALDQAMNLSDSANAGWGAGARAAVGNNLPDLMVPDFVSSPESSAATTNFDNAVIGQALTQLKAIFGGAPTEGERKILLDLQGASSMPKEVRKEILNRAKTLAEKRLEFNRQRAASLRGGDFYKPQGAGVPGPVQPQAIRQTKTGVQWSAE